MTIDRSALDTIRRITANRPAPVLGERCEMCAVDIGEEHQHVVSLESRVLMCTCRGCYLLFTDESARLRYRAVPDRFLSFPDLDPSGGGWAALEIPVGLAFLFRNSVQERVVAFYPGPAGATESDLPLASWDEIVAASPELGTLRPDVEALLIRTPDHEQEGSVHLVPIDRCYELVGRLRTPVARVRRWTGRPGGDRRVLRDGGRQEQAGGSSMSAFSFTIVDIFAEQYAATPQLTVRLRIEESTGQTIHAIALRCQVRIEPQKRPYDVADETGLRALFGDRDRWTDTLKPFLWMQAGAMVQGFTDITEVDLPLPCTYDFDLTGSRYLHAVGEGEIPIVLLFSGTIFTRGANGFGVEQVPWDCEASYRLPVSVWHQMIDFYYPNTGWLRLDRDVLTALADFRSQHGLTTWEETVGALLEAKDGAPS